VKFVVAGSVTEIPGGVAVAGGVGVAGVGVAGVIVGGGGIVPLRPPQLAISSDAMIGSASVKAARDRPAGETCECDFLMAISLRLQSYAFEIATAKKLLIAF
jgi:hypothetical protein